MNRNLLEILLLNLKRTNTISNANKLVKAKDWCLIADKNGFMLQITDKNSLREDVDTASVFFRWKSVWMWFFKYGKVR